MGQTDSCLKSNFTWLWKTEKYWTTTETDVNMRFPDLGQFRSGNIERKTLSSNTELWRKYMIRPEEI